MQVGIHKTFFKGYTPYIRRFETILEYNGISHLRLEADDPDFWRLVADVDLFVFWWRHDNGDEHIAKAILPIVENEMGIPCLPSQRTWWTFDDKIKQYYLLRFHGFPMVPSWIFWDKQKALNWFSNARLPVVFKLRGGAGSENVILVESNRLGERAIRKMFNSGIKSTRIPWRSTRWKDFQLSKAVRHVGANAIRKIQGAAMPVLELHKNYVLFQKFMPNNHYDTRVTVIGKRAFAFRRLNRPNDFRSSGSGRIEYDVESIDKRFITLAIAISEKMGFQSMAYDFLYDENGVPTFCEISYAYVDTAVYNCPGYWDGSLNWHHGHFWPQYCQLVDALKLPDLKQPEMS